MILYDWSRYAIAMMAEKLANVCGRLPARAKAWNHDVCSVPKCHCPAHAPLKKGTRLKLALHSVLVGSFRNLKDLLFGGCCCPITSQDMIVQCVIRRIACFLLLPLVQVPKPSDVDKGISQGPQQSCPADSWTNRFS